MVTQKRERFILLVGGAQERHRSDMRGSELMS